MTKEWEPNNTLDNIYKESEVKVKATLYSLHPEWIGLTSIELLRVMGDNGYTVNHSIDHTHFKGKFELLLNGKVIGVYPYPLSLILENRDSL